MRFFCIADRASSLGFKLAGVDTREVSVRSEALEALKVAVSSEDVGILLITQKAASFIEGELDELLYSKPLPLVLEIPSRGIDTKKPKTAGEVLKKAIGISI
ncbi:MAG: V-type ATP synthase subunit F [Candidatus Omnitrophota bacterium]|jgi:vacuolar-type H+-ATPase subunit F/Vma7|nr:V-type ATP synthase subunit F [Candidatus Omnitrophota bacterium]